MSWRARMALIAALGTSGAAFACMEHEWGADIALVRAAINDYEAYLSLPADSQGEASHRIEDNNGRLLEIARRCGQRCPSELRAALFDYVLANDGSADERLSEATLEMYMQYKSGFCADLGTRAAAERDALLERARTGAALTQPEPIEVSCP